jgi:dihydroneopterin aldolase
VGADRILISGLHTEAHIGVSEAERAQPMMLRLDVELGLSLRQAGQSDRLADTVDYAAVAEQLRAWCAASRCRLLEALAETLAARLLAAFPVSWVRLTLCKEAILDGATAGIVIVRGAAAATPSPDME